MKGSKPGNKKYKMTVDRSSDKLIRIRVRKRKQMDPHGAGFRASFDPGRAYRPETMMLLLDKYEQGIILCKDVGF